MKIAGMVVLATLAIVAATPHKWGEQAPSNIRKQGRNLYKRLTNHCVSCSQYKYTRPARAAQVDGAAHGSHVDGSNTTNLVMNKAELYQQSNALQKRDAQAALDEFKTKIVWKDHASVLDIGSGDGGVTTTILKNYIPADFKNLTGADLSDRMVRYANQHYHDERTQFVKMDIGSEMTVTNTFDYVFSFYTVHWVHNKERVFANVYKLLSEGGQSLLIFLGHMPLYDVFRRLAQMPAWSAYLRDVESFVSPYHDSKDPEKEIRQLMADEGFKNIDVKIKDKHFVFPNLQIVKAAVTAVNPFPIPEAQTDAFFNDYIDIARQLHLIAEDENAVNIGFNYTLIVTYGKKENM